MKKTLKKIVLTLLAVTLSVMAVCPLFVQAETCVHTYNGKAIDDALVYYVGGDGAYYKDTVGNKVYVYTAEDGVEPFKAMGNSLIPDEDQAGYGTGYFFCEACGSLIVINMKKSAVPVVETPAPTVEPTIEPSVEESVAPSVEPTVEEIPVEPSTGVVAGVIEKANDFANDLFVFLTSAFVGLVIAALGWISKIKTSKKLDMITAAYQQQGEDNSKMKEAVEQLKSVAEAYGQMKDEIKQAKKELVATVTNGTGLDQQSLADIELLLNTGLEIMNQLKAASQLTWKNVEGVPEIYSRKADIAAASQLALENNLLINKIEELGTQNAKEIVAEIKTKAAEIGESGK